MLFCWSAAADSLQQVGWDAAAHVGQTWRRVGRQGACFAGVFNPLEAGSYASVYGTRCRAARSVACTSSRPPVHWLPPAVPRHCRS